MIEVGEVQTDADGRTNRTDGRGFQHMLPATSLFVADSLNDKGDDHCEDNKQIVVGHLYVVGQHLQGREQCR